MLDDLDNDALICISVCEHFLIVRHLSKKTAKLNASAGRQTRQTTVARKNAHLTSIKRAGTSHRIAPPNNLRTVLKEAGRRVGCMLVVVHANPDGHVSGLLFTFSVKREHVLATPFVRCTAAWPTG